jgi:RNA-binding protein YlmH
MEGETAMSLSADGRLEMMTKAIVGGAEKQIPVGNDKKGNDETTADVKLERLQKILAAAGVASRRKAEEIILAGRVQVNGITIRRGTISGWTGSC